MYLFGIVGDRRVEAAQILKAFRLCSDLLFKLTAAAAFGVLTIFKLACGQLGKHLAKRISELLNHKHVLVLVQCSNAHSARVMYHLTHGFIAVVKLYIVAEKLDDHTVIYLL